MMISRHTPTRTKSHEIKKDMYEDIIFKYEYNFLRRVDLGRVRGQHAVWIQVKFYLIIIVIAISNAIIIAIVIAIIIAIIRLSIRTTYIMDTTT